MDKSLIDRLIIYLLAVSNYAKDIHYNCKGDNFYGNHIFADRIIDEVAGLMKSAGCDDELIRTAIGIMEKIGYYKSETVENKDDEKKVEDLKDDLKKDY